MLRPSGFPEYTPDQQKLYDEILGLIGDTFRSYSYDHIWTPAVEKNEILTKGGSDIQNQIFGLHGLKQGADDLKEYSLHFDLTVPFARYVLDHLSDITLPFKRYQIQPVWRGERAQKGRFKEFWQCDIDSIWRSDTSLGVRYDIETISVLQKTLHKVLDHFCIQVDFTTRMSHIGLTKKRLAHIGIVNIGDVCALLDDYYKLDLATFQSKLQTITTATQLSQIIYLLQTADTSVLQGLDGYEDLNYILTTLQNLGHSVVYDLSIVRGLGYYTGTVFETFLSDGGGSICSGGAYSNFTDFIDPKISLSGVGGSIGISRLMDYLRSKVSQYNGKDRYLIINFEETAHLLPLLQDQLIQSDKIVELYPAPHKLKKQFEYADRKDIEYCIVYGESEMAANHLIVKNLKDASQTLCPIEQSAGIIPYRYQPDGTIQILIIEMINGPYRSFSKGHINPGESSIQAACRETKEETNLTIDPALILQGSPLYEYVLVHQGQRTFFKQTQYYVALYQGDEELITQQSEIRSALRCDLEKALLLATYPTAKNIVRRIQRLLIS